MLFFSLPFVSEPSQKAPASPLASTVVDVRDQVTIDTTSLHHHEEWEVGSLDHYIDSRVSGERFRIS